MMFLSPEEEMLAVRRAVKRAGCTVDELGIEGTRAGRRAVGRIACVNGWGAARLLLSQAIEDSQTEGVRELAGTLRHASFSDRDFARRIQSFVKKHVAFVPEEGEVFTGSAYTMATAGGDCDDHARLVYALARAGGLDAALAFLHYPPPDDDPTHAVAMICFGERCEWVETTLDAEFGEHPNAAAKRLRLVSAREDLAPEVRIMTEADLESDARAMRELGFLDPGELLTPEAVRLAQRGMGGGLVVDGILGPKTRRALAIRLPQDEFGMGYLAAATTRTEAARQTMADALSALGIALPPRGREMVLAIAYLETRFGSPDLKWGDSHNWGGVTFNAKRGEPFVSWGSLDHPDRDRNGNPVVYHFQRYPSDLEGAKDMARIALRSAEAKAAAAEGTEEDLAAAMFDAGYYTGVSGTREDRIHAYASAMKGAMAKLGAPSSSPSSGGIVGAAKVLGVLLFAFGVGALIRHYQ